MIDPVLFGFKLFGVQIELTWYGLIVMSGVLIGAWLAEREVRRRGENGEVLIDAMVWAVIGGILGARLWYVANAIIGGNRSYIDDPISIIRPPIAGLHFFGGLLFGALILFIYLKRNGYDVWLFFDAIAPVTLIGQAFGRLGNFINQELYGPPTKLPWGLSIPAEHRLPQFADLSLYPVETTRFHPTFAYEAILNILAFLFLLWYSRQKEDELKPGAVFGMWLIAAGFIRVFIEFFRPDQPALGESFITTSMLVAFLMGVTGIVMLLVRNGKLQLAVAEGWEEDYQIKQGGQSVAPRSRATAAPANVESDSTLEEKPAPALKKKRTVSKPAENKTTTKKSAAPRKKKTE